MLLNLDPDIVRSGPRLHSTCSKQHGGSASSWADLTRIIQSLYYAPAGRSDSADRGRSIIRVTAD